jgi:phytoene dehydrogenase-like protein
MEHVKTIGIIGAGLSGLVTAKTCLEYGYEVKVFEKDTELGGVWSSSTASIYFRQKTLLPAD